MPQHDKSTEDLDQAIGKIRTNCEQYIASVSEALRIAGSSPEKTRKFVNDIIECKEAIIHKNLF